MTPERLAALDTSDGEYGSGGVYRETVRQLGKDGWLALGWPVEYGGQARSTAEQLVFADEAARARAPIPFLTLNSVAPTIMAYGSPEQKADLLPRIAAGQVHFSIGYSEPDAGTDLASLRTRADRVGDEYVINGQKMWTSLIQYADYVWLACRTDQEAKKHRGLSVLVVPTDAPGFSWTPVHTMAGVTTSATYYQDVRVPLSARIGEENTGWGLITNQLNHERISLTSSTPLRTALEDVTRWARTTPAENGRPMIESQRVQLALGRVHAGIEVLRLMNARTAWTADQGLPLGMADASATKVYATEMAVELYRQLMDVIGPAAVIRKDSPGAVLAGRLERMHRSSLILTFGGGTNEVQRDMIAGAGLAQPIGRR
jgi:alkylation response protein AidB-like acyl-CoA dehydrogenase